MKSRYFLCFAAAVIASAIAINMPILDIAGFISMLAIALGYNEVINLKKHHVSLTKKYVFVFALPALHNKNLS